MEGVHRIANKNFKTLVQVESGDEFEELAASVNDMAVTIDKQFTILSTMAEIDQLILSTFRIENIVNIVLSRMNDVVPSDHVSMAVICSHKEPRFRIYRNAGRGEDGIAIDELQITSLDRQVLMEKPYSTLTVDQEHFPFYLSPLRMTESRSFLLLPIIVENDVFGIIFLGYRNEIMHSEEHVVLACDFSNRVAVALSKASWEEQLFHIAHYDQLTGLPNRMLLKDRLEQAIARAERQESVVALLFLDLDGFKHVNDSLGHASGDTLLRDVALRIDRVMRSEDTVCRIGGDEFVIVNQQFTNLEESLSVTAAFARKVLEALSPPFIIEGREVFSTASIGIACYPADGESSSELLRNADAAMYHAKSLGKNNFQFFSAILNENAVERLELENGLRRSLERQEFEVYYQPKIDSQSNAVCGAEALLRWNHPQRGKVPPDKFIPLCEEIGLMIPIGEWVIRSVCMQTRYWIDQGFSQLRIAINLSPLQFREYGLIGRIENALEESALSPSYLEFEITESAAMEDIEKTIDTLDMLESMGLHLSIDDSGTGYSSLNYLKRFPLHTLKIDQSFIRNLNKESKDAAIVKSIIMLAHSLRFKVVAEGVETRDQFDFLKRLGCDEVQGYYFSPPLSADDFTELLERESASINRPRMCLLN